MHWTGIIIMDCWGGAWHDRSPGSHQFYQQILAHCAHHTFQYVVEATYAISGGFGIDPCLRELPCQQRFTNVLDWGEFAKFPGNQGAWVMAGQSWDACLHQRRLGFCAYLDSDRVRCQLYCHPQLVRHADPMAGDVGHHHFRQDRRVTWESRANGWWRVHRPTLRAQPWL